MNSLLLPPSAFRWALTAALGAVLAVLCAFAPGAAQASSHDGDAPRLVVPGPGVLRAGQRIELRWAGETGDVEELEIMLTIDAPHRRTIQISPELDPGRGVFVWRVPELGRATGRFRVRYEHDGHEVEGTPSARIEILSAVGAPLEPMLLPDGTAEGAPVRSAGVPTARTNASESDADTGLRAHTSAATRTETGPAESVLRTGDAATHTRNDNRPTFVPARN